MKQVENEVVGFYTKELGLNKEALFPLLRNETWLSEEQLKDLGFITSDSNMKIAAKAKVKSKTKKMSKKNKLKDILNALFKDDVCKMIYSADEKEISFPVTIQQALE